jgi:DNA-binding NtrC family response regulator
MMDLKILIVEDQFLEADSLRVILTEAGYRVQGVAKSVAQALSSLDRELPDMVLVDIFLKGDLNGIHLATILHQRNIPFIYLSANSNATTLAEAMNTRPDGFLVKPFREQELLIAMNIAHYRNKKNLEHISRQKKWLTGLLENVGKVRGTREEKIQALIVGLTSFLPMDYVIVDTRPNDNNPQSLYQFQRIAFDKFRRVDRNNNTGHSLYPDANSYRLKHIGKINPYFLNGTDFFSAFGHDRLWDQIRSDRNLQAQLWLPIMNLRGMDMSISFFSCSDERYTPDHFSLMTSLQDLMASVIDGMRKNQDPIFQHDESPGENRSLLLKPHFDGIIGSSPKLLDALDKVTQVAPYDNTVLVLGETGVGKEGLVKAIHHSSNRSGKPLIKVNCAAIPANLVESELFGHEKGAFTGALEKRIGKFEQASGGTLFLDEIGEMPLEVQSKVLRAIQEKEIERVGGRTTIQTDVRIVTATNRDLLKEIAAGKFRLDLYYRINVFPITLPPLRERKDDIPLLADHFLQSMGSRVRPGVAFSFSPAALEQLVSYCWPGNIREMEHLIERHVLQARSNVIESFDMPAPIYPTQQEIHQDPEIKSFEEMDRDHIVKALKKCNGKVSGRGGAAELLNLRPTTLTSKMKRLGITLPRASA